MADTTQTAKPSLYDLTSTVAGISLRQSAKGTSYFVGNLSTTLHGKPARVAVMGFGKALEAVRAQLVDGASLKLRGSFGTGEKGRPTFTIVGFAGSRKAAEQKAA